MTAREYAARLTLASAPRPEALELAPAGQLVAPWPGGQLGLDGRTYAPAPAPASESGDAGPSEASRSLGPPHGLLHGVSLDPPNGYQLTLWERLNVAAGLLGGTEHDRQAKCHRTRRVAPGESIGLRRSERGSWSTHGLVVCDHYTCPSCGPRRARTTAAGIGAAMRAHLAASQYSDVWMLSLTIPHYAHDVTASTVAKLYAATEALWRSKAWKRFARRWGIESRVRVLDATFSGSRGTHPHFHIALFPRGAIAGTEALRGWSKKDRAAWLDHLASELAPVWSEAAIGAGVRPRNRAELDRHGCKLTGSEHAERYFTKWGLADEVGASTLKRDNHLALLDRAGTGDMVAAAKYRDYRDAVDGRAWVTGLADTLARVGVGDAELRVYVELLRQRREQQLLAEGKALPELKRPLQLEIKSHLFRAALVVGWAEVIATVERAEVTLGGSPYRDLEVQGELDRYLWQNLPRRGWSGDG